MEGPVRRWAGNPPMGIVAVGVIVGVSVGALGMVVVDAAMGGTPTFLLIVIMVLTLVLTSWLTRLFNQIYLRSFKRVNR
jgi:hypothetical protein